MYIRLHIYEKKEDSKYNKPLRSYDINGEHAIKLTILYLFEFHYPKLREAVKRLIETTEV